MKTMIEFIDKITSLWPSMTKEEKEEFCIALSTGSVFKVNTILKEVQKNIKNREKRKSKNENKTN
jgi:hypothetical protein